MKRNRVFRLLASLTVVVLCMTAFSVTAFGPGTLNYTWYNVTGGEPGTQVGGNSPTLTLANVTAAMPMGTTSALIRIR